MLHHSFEMKTQNWHSIFCLRGNEDNAKDLYRRAELAIIRIIRKLIVEYSFKFYRVIVSYKLVQLYAEYITVYDYILRQLRGSTSFMDVILMIGALDHLQIQPTYDKPFIISYSIIPCSKMFYLNVMFVHLVINLSNSNQ